MNKIYNYLITGLLFFFSIFSSSAQKFEAEIATLVGGAKIVYDDAVSGGAYVSQEEGHLTWNLELEEEAFYNIYVHAASPSGRKTNYFSVNNSQVDFAIDQSTQYSRKLVVSTIKLSAGNHIIKIIKSWGWINIDYIEFEIVDPADRFQINKNLVIPDPTMNTARLYQFLYDNYGKKIISGAMTLNSMDEINWLKSNTGKEPALIGLDFMHCGRGYSWYNNDEPVNDAKKYYARNGIPAFCWHWRDPSRATEAFYTESTNFDVSKIFDTSSSEYKAMLNDIDYISGLLKKLYDSDVPVLWRPLHEASGGWFWWGAKGPEPCKALYRLMYERMVNHHGLKNLIWVWTSQQNDYSWYPGDDVVDMIGRDIYKDGDHSSQILEFNKLNDEYGRKKMVTLSETGSFPDVDNLIADEAAWSYFMPWYGQFVRDSKYNSLDLWKKMFAHEYVLTLDEMPDLKSYTTPEGTWRSKLYPENWQPGFMDDRNRFLHDFSYAGYYQGEQEIPFISENILNVTLPPYNADNSGTTDATSAIQKALDDAGQAGGGVVLLPAGTYMVNPGNTAAALRISYNNTILRGAGTDSTFIYNDATFMRQKNIILMTGEAASWSTPVGTNVKLRTDLMFPTQVIPVESVTGFKPGDEIILRSGETSAFIEEHGMAGIWTDWSSRVMFHRTIDSIDVENKLIYIDSPTRYYMKIRDNARLYHSKQHITGCGIENLSIGNRQNDKNGWEEEDYTSQVNGAYDVHASHAINLKNAYNCWVKNIHTYRPESNSDDIHILSNCLLLDQCRGITVDSCFFQKPQYEGGGGNGYMFTLQSNDCLIKNSRANHSRHNFDFKFPHSNGNVIHNCIAENSKYSSDFHMYLSMANLFDVTTVDGDYLESTFRPWGGSVIHGYSSTQSVFYNTTGLAYHSNRDYIIESRQYRHGYIIGTSGPAYRVKLDPVGGSTGGYSYDTSPRDWSEGIGTGDQLIPHSLYLDQLQKRNSRPGLPAYDLSVIVKDSVSGEPIQGVRVNNFETAEITDETGTALFKNVNSLVSLSLERENYHGFRNRQITVSRDTTLLLKMVTSEYNVSIVAVDAKTGAGFTGAMVTLGSMAGATNENGEVSFKVFGGTYDYQINKNSYETAVGTLSIISDTILLFQLNRTSAFIKFRLKEGESPVNNALVALNDTQTQITSNLGMVTFKDLPVKLDYSYHISKNGYKEISGQFFLEQDTLVDLRMEPATTSAFATNRNSFKVWPNPAQRYLHVEFPVLPVGDIMLRILDLRGNVLRTTQPTENNFRLDIENLPAGMYILKITSSSFSSDKIFVKRVIE